MGSSDLELNAPRHSGFRRWLPVAEIALVFLVFFIHAGWPPPSANEPHYLGKAKHYWNPEWCARDFFLNSADAHQVFYWSFGWVSLWLPLPVLAWTGRVVTWALLAAAWRTMSAAIVPGPLYSVLTAGLFVSLNERANMAGEWVVGGVEAKGFAYALVMLAIAAIAVRRWNTAWLLLGVASSFHVLVGGWSVVAAGVAWLTAPSDRPRFVSMLPGLLAGAVLALPGLVPALMLTRGVPPDVVAQSNVIYVFQRLPHHLVPQTFPIWFLARLGLLAMAWVALSVMVPGDSRDRHLRRFVYASIGIAVAGLLLSFIAQLNKEVAAGLLRYYWFRMSDAILPLGVAVLVARLIDIRRSAGMTTRSTAVLMVGMLLIAGHLGRTVLDRQLRPCPLADRGVASLEDWQEACAWVRQQTPADSLFLVPRLSQTFRWYAHRAEVVAKKDIPQDARGIIEWQRRLHDIYLATASDGSQYWHDNLAELGNDRIVELGRKYQADYIITDAQPALGLKRVGLADNAYAIYEIPREAGRPRSAQPTQAAE